MNTEGFDKLDTLLKSLTYEQLSASEKAYVEEQIGGEKAYRDMQKWMIDLRHSPEAPVSSRVKTDLMKRYKAKHQSWVVKVVQFQTPAYLNVAASLVLLLLFWLVMPNKQVEISKTVTVYQTDTVTVQTPADTVYIRETVSVKVPVYVATNSTPAETQPTEIQGSSLKDQKALYDLISQTSP
jgi:hypothetical protein